jgi:hypothetical protein
MRGKCEVEYHKTNRIKSHHFNLDKQAIKASGKKQKYSKGSLKGSRA